jgi:class 3 adenylate cyclase
MVPRMTSRRADIEAALTAWREAERRLGEGPDGDREALEHEVERHRGEFQRLSAEHMMAMIDRLKEAEQRRKTAVPSTEPFHEAAQDERAIAAEIWDSARQSDEDTPMSH